MLNPVDIVKRNAAENVSGLDTLRMLPEITAEQLFHLNMNNIPSLIPPIIPRTGLIALGGASDVGKSSLLRYLALIVSVEEPSFLDFPVEPIHRSAIYVSTEDGLESTSYLIRRTSQSMSIGPERLKNLRFIFYQDNLIATLEDSLSKKPADLVVIDAFTDLYPGNLNEANRVRAYLTEYSALANKHGCLIIFLHHVGKGKDFEPPSKHNLIGSQAFEAKMRLVLELRADPNDSTLRHLCIVKGNYLPTEYKTESFVLMFKNDFTFKNTGDRKHFDLIVKNPAEESRKSKYLEAKAFKDQGLNYDEIARLIGYKSKSSVSDLFNRYDAQQEI
jgi:RecA-family ATPase